MGAAVGYGPERLLAELRALGYDPELQAGASGGVFAVLRGFEVTLGRFAGRVVDLGIPATANFPLAVGAAIHVSADPQLLELGHVQNVRNVIASELGADWRYWSKNLNWPGEQERSAARLMRQINGVFEHA